MRWYDEEALNHFVTQCSDASGARGVTIGDVVLSGAVSSLDAYLAAALANEDAQLASAFDRLEWVRSVRSRAFMFEHEVSDPRASDAEEPKRLSPAPTRNPELQMVLFPSEEPRKTAVPMPSLAIDQKFRGSVWIPRILWALMHAEQTNTEALTAAEIDRTLSEHAGINIHGTNVARAFRDLKDTGDALWVCQGRRYSLTDAGRRAFCAVFHDFTAPS